VSLDIAQDTTNWNDKQWKKTVRSMVGVDIYTREPWLKDTIDGFEKENASLIRKLADETREDIESIVSRGFRQGKSAATLKKEILNGTDLEPGRFRKTKTRAKLIARDQVNKLNGQLTEMRQTELGITQYIWRTSVDERVRENHKVMEGKTCRWDNSAVYKSGGKWISRSSIGGVELHPGQDYQCRCYAEADFSTLLGEEMAPVPEPDVTPVAPPPPPPPPVVKKVVPVPVVKKTAPTPMAEDWQAFSPDLAKMETTMRAVSEPEYGGAINSKTGKQLFYKQGDQLSIKLTDAESKLMRGQVFTHTHPNGSSFSFADIAAAGSHYLKEMRVVGIQARDNGERFLYRLKTGMQTNQIYTFTKDTTFLSPHTRFALSGPVKSETITAGTTVTRAEYYEYQINHEWVTKYRATIAPGKRSVEDAFILLTHDVISELASKFKFAYKRELIK
jgi:SPP1 gp7 family putative phage head morphogenesis protein